MNPDRHANSHYDYFQDLIKGDNSSVESHRKFYDEYNAVLDMDANYYLETINTVFQEFKLVNGTWDVENPQGKPERVRPEDIQTTALLTVEGELDDISGAGQTEAAHGLCKNIPEGHRKHLIVEQAGHYGIFSGRRWRENVYPHVRDFILAHQPQPTAEKPAAAVVEAVKAAAPKTEKAAAKPKAKAAPKKPAKVTEQAPEVLTPVVAAPVVAEVAPIAAAPELPASPETGSAA